ncbi:MAG: cbb3-type cytochrome oxidase assembly protein CcoS [Leptothrix sp. (in: b-proteobacteria)]
MDILYLLIPLSVGLVFGIMALFAWALKGGQFDDIEREGERILRDDANERAGVDADQVPIAPRVEQSPTND